MMQELCEVMLLVPHSEHRTVASYGIEGRTLTCTLYTVSTPKIKMCVTCLINELRYLGSLNRRQVLEKLNYTVKHNFGLVQSSTGVKLVIVCFVTKIASG